MRPRAMAPQADQPKPSTVKRGMEAPTNRAADTWGRGGVTYNVDELIIMIIMNER